MRHTDTIEKRRQDAARETPLKSVLRYAALFAGTAALLLLLLLAVTRIPRAAIRDNVLDSARYLCEGELFGTVVEEVNGSRIDRYADAILLGIAWQFDGERPLAAVMRAAYYHDPYQNENANLLRAVTEDYPANQQYLRYWHGSLVLLRPLLTVLDVREIYVLHGVLLSAAAVGLLALLLRRKAYAPALGAGLGMAATAFFFVPLSLEYYWVPMLTLLLSALVVWRCERWRDFGAFFLIAGIVTNFLDFLTAETLTLLIPLLLLLWLRRDLSPMKTSLRLTLLWGVGYAGMWVLKWGLAAAVLRENILPDLTAHIEERLGADFYHVGELRLLTGAVTRNVACLFPLNYGLVGVLAALALAVFAVYYAFVYRRPGYDARLLLTLSAAGLLPYARYLALRSHSYIHCFFTYRAQMATVLAAVLILAELTARRRGPPRRKNAPSGA